ncbi:zona pellucida-binding protein 2 isoform X2 [Microcaecilia unicolor]|uniref:Zona pellucida-binding protein 2 isoform X2 n=1 Tax=Microcaecilia unicolor TaxID=1415580 RepID=A0A6P7ZWI5_9AMPH|nr:zona pellucida-binding protein 2 isoform X2 [Microcaecilia unicolor]
MRPLVGLGPLLMVALLSGAMVSGDPRINSRFIYGKLNEKVNVYVKVYWNSPFLACMDESLSRAEIIDPLFLWIGPDGRNLKGQSYVNVTETGKLKLITFRKSMSGSYGCTLTYKRMKDNLQEEKEAFKSYKFMLFAYRDPDYTFQVSARFSTQACNIVENDQYLEELKKIMEDLIFSLTCELTDEFLKCHVIKVPKHGLQSVLFISFKVNPFAPGWETVCRNLTGDCGDETNSRALKARDRIEEFFLKQTYAHKEFSFVPPIRYLDKSLQILREDKCRPGFGKDEFNHAECPDCCVVCGHGTYNSNNNVRCRVCSSIEINYYGATAC